MAEEGETYQRESDHIFAFADEVLTRTGDDGDRIPKSELFEIYLAWCDKQGRERRVTSNVLSRRLVDMEFEHRPMHYASKTQACWYGVQVKGAGINLPGSKE